MEFMRNLRMMRVSLRLILASIILLTLANGALNAQNILSSMVGQVTDASGGGVPEAQVTVTNEGTGISVVVTTEAGGTYTVPNLYAGVYTVQAKKEGFATARITGIQIRAQESVRQDVELKVGSIQESIMVTGSAAMVNTEAANIAGEFTTRQITELPQALQAIDTLLTLVPGGQAYRNPAEPQTGGVAYWGGTNYNVNGLSAVDTGSGRGAPAAGAGMASLSPLSSMQEFKVNVNNMSAEYRMQSSVDMVTKQGTNKFHGEAYEYNQNAALAANTFFNNARGVRKPPMNINQFGANLGGPIWRNKMFFFVNYSGYRRLDYFDVNWINVPGAAMREGNFAALCSTFDANGICTATGGTQLYNPYTGAAFPNNQIPSDMITSQAKTMISYYPLPTVSGSAGLPAGAPNYFGQSGNIWYYNAYDTRFDFQISENDNLTVFSSYNKGDPWVRSFLYPPTYGNAGNYGHRKHMHQVAESHTFSPNTISEFRIGFFRYNMFRDGQNLDFDPRSLFPQQPDSEQRGLPTARFNGYTEIVDWGKGPVRNQPDVEIMEHLTHVHGRHTIKGGADIAAYQFFNGNSLATLPTFSFNGVWTGNKGNPGQPQSVGNAFADFLLGTANGSSTSVVGHDTKIYSKNYEIYVMDTWQATPRLTLTYGVRYQYQEPWTHRDNLRTGYDFATNKMVLPQDSATPTLPTAQASAAAFDYYNNLGLFTTTQALGWNTDQYYKPEKAMWGPRVGFAWRPFSSGNTVLRGGYGIYYNFWSFCCGAGVQYEWLNPPWASSGAGYGGTSFSSKLPGNPTSQFLPDLTFSDPFPSAVSGGTIVSPNPTLYVGEINSRHAALSGWNLTLEHQITLNNMVRATYVGNHMSHVLNYQHDVNIPDVQTPNVPLQAQRPRQPYGGLLYFHTGGKQNLEQLQLAYIRRFAAGLVADVEYQWTRSLGDAVIVGGPQNPSRPGLDYGNTQGTVRHVLAASYIYELPFGRGKRYLSNVHSVVDGVLGGWQISGINLIQTGDPFSVNFSVPAGYVGWRGGRADIVPNVDPYAGKQSGHDVINGVQWFNTAAFAPPQPWQWGNSAPYLLFGPGLWNWDLSVKKEFRIPIRGLENPRLQIRADFFDVLNHFNVSMGHFNYTGLIADTRDGGSPIGSSGKVYSGEGSRLIQVGVRFYF